MRPATPGGNGATAGQPDATLPGGALEAPSGRASMASGGESAVLLDMVAHRLLSDDYEAYDPEDPIVRALMADYEATILDKGLDTNAAQGHPPVGEIPGPAGAAGQMGVTPFDGALEAPSDQASTPLCGESADLLDMVAHRLLFDDYEAYDPEDPNIRALMADYEATIMDTSEPSFEGALEAPSSRAAMTSGGESAKRSAEPAADPDHAREKQRARNDDIRMTGDQRQALLHIFETGLKRSDQSLADEFGVCYSTIRKLRKKFGKTGNLKPRGSTNRLTVDQRRALLHIFKTDPGRSNQSIADEMDVSPSTIFLLRHRFSKTGDIQPGDHAKRLTVDQRRALLHIFKTDPIRSNQSIADEFDISIRTIQSSKGQISKTGDIQPGDYAKRLTVDQRRALLHIFETNPERSNQSIVDEMDISLSTIQFLRKKFSETGDIQPGDHAKRLTVDQQRALLHIFETDPERNNKSIADETGLSLSTIRRLRKKFGITGSLKPGDHANRLTVDQRRALLHIFETDPERSNHSLMDEFGVAYSTIHMLRKRFNETGNIQPGDSTNRLTVDQRRALLHIFETDPKRSNHSLVDEFGVALSTIKLLRKRFSKTGDIQPGNSGNRLTDNQRRALLHIFETDPKRTTQSLADDFGVATKTIRLLRRKFNET